MVISPRETKVHKFDNLKRQVEGQIITDRIALNDLGDFHVKITGKKMVKLAVPPVTSN